MGRDWLRNLRGREHHQKGGAQPGNAPAGHKGNGGSARSRPPKIDPYLVFLEVLRAELVDRGIYSVPSIMARDGWQSDALVSVGRGAAYMPSVDQVRAAYETAVETTRIMEVKRAW